MVGAINPGVAGDFCPGTKGWFLKAQGWIWAREHLIPRAAHRLRWLTTSI